MAAAVATGRASAPDARPLALAAPPPVPLTLAGVTKSWGKREILVDLDLTLAPGDLVWLGGRNGVGKTTLLRIASGLIRPQRGTIRLLGHDPEKERTAFQRKLGFLSAGDRGLYPRLNGRQHLEFWTSLALISAARRRELIAGAIADFDLDDILDRRVDRLSLGQRQRLRLAMAFLHEPEVVLLDEPRNSLDDEGAAALEAAVERVARRGGAAVWCSPKGDPVRFAFTRRLVLEGGRLETA